MISGRSYGINLGLPPDLGEMISGLDRALHSNSKLFAERDDMLRGVEDIYREVKQLGILQLEEIVEKVIATIE